MWLVKFANDNYVEFYAIDIEELMLLIVEYTGNDRKYFEKAMNGFERLDLCKKCQKELENWIGGLSFKSNLNPTLRNGA